MDKRSKIAILIGIVAIIAVGAFFYFTDGKNNSDFPDRNFPLGNINSTREENFNKSFSPQGNFSQEVNLNDETKKEIAEFFGSSPSLEESIKYCSSSSINCMYYCMEVDRENQICSELNSGER